MIHRIGSTLIATELAGDRDPEGRRLYRWCIADSGKDVLQFGTVSAENAHVALRVIVFELMFAVSGGRIDGLGEPFGDDVIALFTFEQLENAELILELQAHA